MRKSFFVALLLALPFALGQSFAQTRNQMGGVYYAYPSPQGSLAASADAVPSALTPVYISHYGRHGSRWMTSDERYMWVNEHFSDTRNLTPLGRSLRRRLKRVWANARGNGGRLTPIGAAQHRGIAGRMVSAWSSVFAEGRSVEARSSVADRCAKSMRAFVGRVGELCPSVSVSEQTDSSFMAWIAYNSPEQRSLERRPLPFPADYSLERFLRALFKDPSRVAEPLRLFTELHTVASSMQDVGLDISFDDIFTLDEFRAVYEANNRRMTLFNAETPFNEGIPQRSAVSLWRDIEQQADRALADPSLAATLRFGHDTNLLRLVALMQLQPQPSTFIHQSLDSVNLPPSPFPHSLAMDSIVPMAANLQMVFFRVKHGGSASSDDVVVRLLLNERDVFLPIQHQTFGSQPADASLAPAYYRWSDMKAHMARRIHHFDHLGQLCAINTRVGTAQANTLTAGLFGKGSEEHGQTLPAVLSPNGQNAWTPQTQDSEQKCVAPYYYRDSLFQGFRNSHWIVGGCTQDYGSFTVAALTGSLRTSAAVRATPFSHADEVAHPHYYAVTLSQERLRVELTAQSHTAMLRLTPQADAPEELHIVIQPNSDEGQGYIVVDTCAKVVYGYNPVHRIYQGWGEPAGFSGHFVLRYGDAGATLVDFGTFQGDQHFPRQLERGAKPVGGVERKAAPQTPIGAYLSFRCHGSRSLLLTMASSFTGKEGALGNMREETRNGTVGFDEMAQNLACSWISRLHTIDVDDPDTARVNQFYGALYRASFLPRELSDVDGARPRFADGSVLTKGHGMAFTDFSAWDTYRALHPLYNIILPSLSGLMMQSLADMYEEGGWMPIFPCWNSYTAAMIGDHCSAILADAYVKGIRHFDAEKAYQGMRQNAFQEPLTLAEYQNGMGRRALGSYLRHGFVPLEDKVADAFHTEEQTSRTLEYAFDDFAVAQMARLLGHEADHRLLMKRSENWRNVINPATGWADGRHADGSWEGNTDLVHRKPYITEGATCHYTWYVPQHIRGLMDVMGGETAFEQKLDTMFQTSQQGAGPLYWHGNEPCHQIPFLFNFTAHPWKTQRWVRHILDTEYNDTPGGLSGNDDAGQMSAWYIFASMGLFPVCPASPVYELASPTFRRVTLNLENGRSFTIEAPNASRQNIYVGRVELDGRPLPSLQGEKDYVGSPFSISHDDILRGATLHFEMSKFY